MLTLQSQIKQIKRRNETNRRVFDVSVMVNDLYFTPLHCITGLLLSYI